MILTANGPIAWAFGKVFDFIYNLLANSDGVANLGLVIILFTVFVKLILLPMTINQQRSSKINNYIQPEIKKIQKKYKGKQDNESMMKMQQETQAVYDKYGTKMTAGCLSSLIQLPIIWGLYDVIRNVPAYVGSIKSLYEPIAKGILGMKDYATVLNTFVTDNKITTATSAAKELVSASDVTTNQIIDVIGKFDVSNWELFKEVASSDVVAAISANLPKITEINEFMFGINLTEAPGFKLSAALIIPILSALFQYLSTKTMEIKTDPDDENAAAMGMMKNMTTFMPLMSLFIGITLPAGVGIYWAMNALLTLIIQLIINFYYKKVDMDKLIEKQVAKAAKKKKKNKKSFMQRMMDYSMNLQEQQESLSAASKTATNTNLRNYDTSKLESKNNNNTIKEGSLASKANIMLQYKDKGKGDK